MVYGTGSIYDGDWVKGVKYGRGVYIFSDGSTYDGTWVDNARDGKGKQNFLNGDIYIGHTMSITLSADHRVIDGAVGATFVASITEYLSNPLRLIL